MEETKNADDVAAKEKTANPITTKIVDANWMFAILLYLVRGIDIVKHIGVEPESIAI